MIKQKLVALANRILRPLDAKLVNIKLCEVDMPSALGRIPTHGRAVNTVIDIGASNGKWLDQMTPLFPNAHFLAIEPLEENATALAQWCRDNPKRHYSISAAGAVDGQTASLTVPDQMDGSSIDGSVGTARAVPLRTIDALVAEYKLPPPYLLKFDTHGYEVPILEGAVATLIQTEFVIMEVYNFQVTPHTRRFHEMCAIMEEKGFRCYDMADPMLRPYDKVLWQIDLFFCRAERDFFALTNVF